MLRREIKIFIVVGLLTVLIDFLTYRGLLWSHLLGTNMAKASGFLAGTLFAYVANRFWTFNQTRHASGSAFRFMIVYLCNLGVNVLTNSLVLRELATSNISLNIHSAGRVFVAFLFATLLSATLNFLGMKFYAFKAAKNNAPLENHDPLHLMKNGDSHQTLSGMTHKLLSKLHINKNPKFSLVIPCYNEAKSLSALLDRCQNMALKSHETIPELTVEILLVDNGSTDNTPEVLKELLPKYPACRSIRVEKNEGYGFGILSGLRAATGDLLGWTHADLQTNPEDVINGLALFIEHGSHIFVKGKRYGQAFSDVFFTIGMSIFKSVLLRKLLWDINAQPTLFPREFFESWENPPHDCSLDLYAYYRARVAKLKIYRFPVLFSNRVHGVSHWNANWAAKVKFNQLNH